MKFKVGDTYHIMLGLKKPHKIHIVSIVDDNMVVYKWYGRMQQWWHYVIEIDSILEIKIERARNHHAHKEV